MIHRLRPILHEDLAALAALHAVCFPEDRWDEKALAELLAMQGARGRLVAGPDTVHPLGFILDLTLAEEAEILTLCVAPVARRRGIAGALLDDLFARARGAGARSAGLEVAADNLAARRLYEAYGFVQTGRRRGYYRRGTTAVDALLFRRRLLG